MLWQLFLPESKTHGQTTPMCFVIWVNLMATHFVYACVAVTNCMLVIKLDGSFPPVFKLSYANILLTVA